MFAYISLLYQHYYLNLSTVRVRHDVTGVNGINRVICYFMAFVLLVRFYQLE